MLRLRSIVCVGLLLVILARAQPVKGQDDFLRGSTAQGDALRGQGRFLRGMAWYELGSAQARAIDMQTMAAWNQSVQAGYNQYLLERAGRSAARKSATTARVNEAARTMAEIQRRWRENPTVDDIRSGLALNALASDLADPKIPSSSWGAARMELPADLSIQSLVFGFASKPRRKVPGEIAPSTVAVGRMKVDDRWPVTLRRPELQNQRGAYEVAVRTVTGKCARGQSLQAADVDRVRDALFALKDRAALVVPAQGGLLKQAMTYLDRLDEATRIFGDQDFAEELIRDVETHKARTVGELLAFMKKYRLLFADSGDDPAVWDTYQKLYELLKSQKISIDFADAGKAAAEEKKASDRPR